MNHSIHRWFCAVLVGLVSLALANTSHAAPVTPFFTNLVSELHARSTALTGTANKVAKAQKKVIDAALLSVNTAHDAALADDLKLASKIAKSLQTTFPLEFTPSGIATPPGTQTFGSLCAVLVSNLAAEVSADLDTLDTQIDGLAAGAKKKTYLKTAAAARVALGVALTRPTITLEATGLATVETGLVTLEKAVLKTINSSNGGGGTSTMTATAAGLAFNAANPNGVYTSASQELTLNGMVTTSSEVRQIGLTAFSVTGIGTYPLMAGTSYSDYNLSGTWGYNVTGTLVITAWDLAAGTASGTFNLTAAESIPFDPANSVTVANGAFTHATFIKH